MVKMDLTLKIRVASGSSGQFYPQEMKTWRSGVRSAMGVACQLAVGVY